MRTANAFLAARGAHRRQPAVEPPRRDGHRPLPARAAPPDASPTSSTWRLRERAGVPLIGIDNLPGSVPLETFDLPRECVLVFGQEGPGLSRRDARGRATVVLHIEQFGSTRSINAGAAAAIAMHAWVRRHVFGQRPG